MLQRLGQRLFLPGTGASGKAESQSSGLVAGTTFSVTQHPSHSNPQRTGTLRARNAGIWRTAGKLTGANLPSSSASTRPELQIPIAHISYARNQEMKHTQINLLTEISRARNHQPRHTAERLLQTLCVIQPTSFVASLRLLISLLELSR